MTNKHIQALIIAMLLLLSVLLLASCSAKVEEITEGSAAVFASINSPVDSISSGKTDELEGALQWIIDNSEAYNIEYVSFLGNFTTGPEDKYSEYVKSGADTADIIEKNKSDSAWMGQFDSLKSVLGLFEESSLPYGMTYSPEDMYGYGGWRESTYSDIYSADTAIEGRASELVKFDEQNYYSIIDNGAQKFIVFQLEAMPTTPVLDWFNKTMAEKCDYRAIVFTQSLLDSNGEFYQMWDWADGYPYKPENRGNTELRSFNLLWNSKPCDGITLWNYALSKHDNLMLVVSSNIYAPDKIASRVEKTEGGCDVALIAASLEGMSPASLIISVSEDNKTVRAGFVGSDGKCDKGSLTEISLETLSALEPPLNKAIPTAICMHPNGMNPAYLAADSDKFEPDKAITRGEALAAIAELITMHDDQKRVENRFEDLDEDSEYYEAVNYLDSQGHLDSYDEYIDVNKEMTRGELALLIYETARVLEAFPGRIADIDQESENYYTYGYIVHSGYMTLDEENKFNPDKAVTRGEFAHIMNKIIGVTANEKTVDTELLDNLYTDISGHEYEYDILAATNARLDAPYLAEIRTEGIEETETQFIFKNELATITVDKAGAKVKSIVINKTGENVLFSEDALVSLESPASRSDYPTLMERENGRFKFTFEHGEVLYFIIEAHEKFFTFELDTELPLRDMAVTFAVFDTSKEFSTEPNSIRLSGTLMNTNTSTEYYGGGDSKATTATVTNFGVPTRGGKYGVAVSEYQDFVAAMQALADDIDPAVGVVNKSGGAYAQSNPSCYGDYSLTSEAYPERIDELIATAKKYNLKQIDVHQGANSFIQGNYIQGEGFSFTHMPNKTASEFKTLIADKCHEAGLELGLHIYSFYISPSAKDVLAVPEYQKQLEYSETYTLAKDLSKAKPKIETVEDASGFDLDTSFTYKNSTYILIDEEIIRVKEVDETGFVKIDRGVLGTKAARHEAGAEIRHLIHYYGMFAPIVGSELFYDMAEWVAETYNKGGFDMIYFDAHDGLSKHTDNQSYYGAEFVRAVLEKCEKPPVLELSTLYPSIWAARSRMIAWDHATRAYKQFNLNHLNTNKGWMDKMYPTTFGWFSYAPDISYPEKNTLAKTMFKDDLDHMGSLAIAWNVSTAYNDYENINHPVMSANVTYYNEFYNKLRLEGYFSEEVRKQIREGEYEYKVVKKDDGSFVFREMQYSKYKVFNAADADLNTGKGFNPFGEQVPFIRIESRYSTEFQHEHVLLELDETREIENFTGNRNIEPGNLINYKAIKVRVFGNNSPDAAIMITLSYTGPGEYEMTDYVIPLNFEGWKEIVLLDSDSGDYGYDFSSRNVNAVSWDVFREIPDYDKINGIGIATTGDCTGVMMDDIVAYRHTEAPVKNPSVTVGDSTITFNTEIKGGQYIEYDPHTNSAVLNYNDGTEKKISHSGSVSVPSGEFSYTYSAEALTEAPVRAQVVIGCEGKEIANQ